MDLRLLLPPLIGCVIGWLTNYVAIKLLFRPHMPVEVFGYKIQGLIPKRRKEIAGSIARSIERELLSSEDIAATLSDIDWKQEIEKSIEEMVDHRFATNKFKGLPIVGLVSENLKYHIKYIITREVVTHLDKKKNGIVNRFKDRVDVRELVTNNIDKLDTSRFEGLLTEFIARELKHLEWLGGLMGFLIGIIQSLLLYFIF